MWITCRIMKPKKTFFKEWRKFRRLTQEQVAEALGSSSGYVSDMENGKRRYNQDYLEELAGILECEPAELLSVDPSNPNPQQEVIDIWEHIPNRWRERALKSLEAFKEDDKKDRA